MKKGILTTLFAFFTLFPGLAQDNRGAAGGTTAPDTAEYDVFLLIGQSNMSGSGIMLPEDTVYVLPGTWLLNEEGVPEPAVGSLTRYSSVRKKTYKPRIGPGNSFGPAVARATGRKVLLVVNALGGSSIRFWQKDSPVTTEKLSVGYGELQLYAEAVRRTKQALRHGSLKAILWQQGEADARTRRDVYMGMLARMVADLRKDLDAPNVPFIAGELGYWKPNFVEFNKLIRTISDVIPNSAWRSAEGAEMRSNAEDPHFSRTGHILLGERYAEIVLRMCYPGIAAEANP